MERSSCGTLRPVNSLGIWWPWILAVLAGLCGVLGAYPEVHSAIVWTLLIDLSNFRANDTKLICAVGSRNGTEDTKLMVLDFDVEGACLKCS